MERYLVALDRYENPLGYLTHAKNVQVRARLNGDDILSFELPLTDEYAYLELDGFVRLDDQLYIIKTIEELGEDRNYVTVRCVHVSDELTDEYIDRTVELLGVPATLALTEALRDTHFQVGTVNAPGLRDIDISEMSVRQALNLIREKWDVDLWFDNRTVYLGTRGVNNREEIRYGKNLKSLRKPTSTADIITRLYVYGRDGLTIEAVNNGKKYIDSPNIGLYRRPKVGSVRFNDIKDPMELLEEGQRYLAKRDKVNVSYSVDYVGDRFGLGDVVTITHLPFNLQTVGTRVVELIYYPLENRVNTAVLSSRIESTVDEIVNMRRRQYAMERYTYYRDAEFQRQTDELSEAQTDFQAYVDSTFRDGIITESEALAIGQHKSELQKEKADVDAEYDKTYNHPAVTGSAKTALQNAKSEYDTAYTALVSAIDIVIQDRKVTEAERTDIEMKFSTLTNKLSVLRIRLEDAWALITQATANEAENNAKNYTDNNYGDTKEKVQNGDIYVRDKYGQIIVNEEGLDLEGIAGVGVEKGCVIRMENRTQSQRISATVTVAKTWQQVDGVVTVDDTSQLPTSNSTPNLYLIHFPGQVTVTEDGVTNRILEARDFWISWTGKTATTLTGVRYGTYGSSSARYIGVNLPAGRAIFRWPTATADIVITAGTVVTPEKKRFNIAETRFNGVALGGGVEDIDGWTYRYFYVDKDGVVRTALAGTSGGVIAYPPDPPAGSVRLGYMLYGYGLEDPDGTFSPGKDYDSTGYPILKERIYHDVRYRDERAIRADGKDVALGGAPYGETILNMTVAPKEYQTHYIQVGAGKRSCNVAITLDDGSGFDNYTYGAQLVVGRKAANLADGKGRPLWATYVDSDGNRGMVSGRRNQSPYGIHVLSPKVWGQTYTMLYDADLMPDPNSPEVIALKLTFYNYSNSVTETFNLRVDWHAL